ncbi:hypothetical protein [Peribacillus glennii]|uniref:Uncharacterized protein n=1 Tax=Peribacillus glennii TaxID=2303991 RepID=A0A372LGR7_9BACI|nr:hypothetical protein [Peribacillus glennii]RFU65132.1 hypothetical protein D0466_04275 [Peribacillus glennii]
MKDSIKNPLSLRVSINTGHSIGEALKVKNLEKIAADEPGLCIFWKFSTEELENRHHRLFEEWNNKLVEKILKDINITDSLIITRVA